VSVCCQASAERRIRFSQDYVAHDLRYEWPSVSRSVAIPLCPSRSAAKFRVGIPRLHLMAGDIERWAWARCPQFRALRLATLRLVIRVLGSGLVGRAIADRPGFRRVGRSAIADATGRWFCARMSRAARSCGPFFHRTRSPQNHNVLSTTFISGSPRAKRRTFSTSAARWRAAITVE
jgi:hypothetical protein